jgi:hypothetical protein
MGEHRAGTGLKEQATALDALLLPQRERHSETDQVGHSRRRYTDHTRVSCVAAHAREHATDGHHDRTQCRFDHDRCHAKTDGQIIGSIRWSTCSVVLSATIARVVRQPLRIDVCAVCEAKEVVSGELSPTIVQRRLLSGLPQRLNLLRAADSDHR